MLQSLRNLETPAYAGLRVIAGFMFSFHGVQKILGWLTERPKPELFSQMWFGGVIELVCGVLVMLGLFTRLAALLASGTMAVAYFQFHFKGETANWSWLPIVNRGEMAALYCWVFLLIAARGPGALSLDRFAHRDT